MPDDKTTQDTDDQTQDQTDQTTDQNQDQNQDQDQDKNQAPTIEEIATKIGWNPDFEGPDAVDAVTYILRGKQIQGDLSKRLRTMSKKMEAMEQAVDVIARQGQAAAESKKADVESNIRTLEAQRQAAIGEGDVDKVRELETQITNLHKSVPEPQKQQAPRAPKEYIEWVANNEWYETDPKMRQWADNYYDNYLPNEVKALGLDEIYNHITGAAQKVFPSKFNQSAQQQQQQQKIKPAAAPVASPQKKAGSKKKYTWDDLSYQQKQIAIQFEKRLSGTKAEMNRDEYANEILGGTQ